nr:DUF6543 domain-containing protein [uncultured Pseudomonas sp.]
MSDTSAKISEDILTQLVTGPSIREVAFTSLRTALETDYPQLHIDPNQAMVVTPVWTIVDDRVIPGKSRFESLTDVLVRLGLSGMTENYVDGEHFLTLQPGVEPVKQLPVKIDAVGCLLNKLARELFVAYQEQQLQYWSEPVDPLTPRWHQLSSSLKDLWSGAKMTDWDEDQRAMALSLYDYPDSDKRKSDDKYATKACLIDIDNQAGEHVRVLDIAVLVGTLEERTLVITHSIAEGFQRYDSLEELGETLLGNVSMGKIDSEMKWRLFEPSGNFFDHQAWVLIALEVEAIGVLGTFTTRLPQPLAPQVGAAATHFADFHDQPSSRYTQIHSLLPDWLAKATPSDLTRYSRHLMDLALLREQSVGKPFDQGILPLPAFALQALTDQMIKDKHIDDQSAATKLNLGDIEVSITSLVVLGAVIVPGQTQTLSLSMVDFALQNLMGMPLGNKTVRYKSGEVAPAWMTPAYLETVVTQVNIGDTYPRLIKSKFFDDLKESVWRQKLYASQLRIQLPLQALQLKIRGQAGIDEHGYRYVVAAMQEKAADRYVDGLEIIIRPLAFIPGGSTDNKADEVANMFVIGPRLVDKGPCLLFRPLLNHPLLQYPGEANLLYAIKNSRTLRQSVLAWLPEDLHFNYSQYVFPGELPSVWTLSQWLTDPKSTLGMMGAVSLSATPLTEPPLQALFTANANAMITLADQQSVSNSERRWATLKQGGWMLFNIALPFLGGTAATAAWIWQIMDDLHQANEARERDDSEDQWAALTDLFLTLGMVLAHQAAARNKPVALAHEKVSIASEKPLPAAKITVTQLPDLAADQLPAKHETCVDTKGLLPKVPLGIFLDGLEIPKPSALEAKPVASGPYRFLFLLNQKWYAKVGKRWFEVMLNDYGDAQIIDSRQTPAKTGPLLIHSAKGEWFIDLRLRLRGGGRNRKDIQRENQQRQTDLKQQLTTFESTKPELKNKLDAAEAAATETDHQLLIEIVDSQLSTYSLYVEQVKAYNALEPIANYRPVIVSCLDYQLSLTRTWFKWQNTVFGEQLQQSLDLFENEAITSTKTPRQIHQLTNDLTQNMIDKIEFTQARIDELPRLGREAAETAREYKTTLPTYDLQDLKLLQISLAQELCLNDSATAATSQTRQALEGLVEDAGLTIQSSLDLAADDNVLALSERIDGFNDLVEQFETLDQRIVDLPDEFPDHLLKTPLDLMRQRIEVFKERTVNHLAELLRERRILEPTPGPSRPAPAPRRIIKTRFKGTVVGRLRERAVGTDTDFVDVTSPLSGKVIATFHEKTPGNWVEHVATTSGLPPTKRPDLKISIETGQSLLDQLQPFTRRTEAHSRKEGRIPVEIEEMFSQQARQMEAAAAAIEQALIDQNVTDAGPGSGVNLVKQLNEGATLLYEKGRLTRISMTKKQLPTAARVEWLHGKGLVEIVKTPGRSLLKGKKDYLEEYEIREQPSQEVLWYAHFHYPAANTPAADYSVAHLKTKSQRLLGGALDLRKATSNDELITIYRSEISPHLARSLFLSKPKSAAPKQ